MDSRVVLITGSSDGIGEATACLFARKGFQVAVHGSASAEKVNKVVEKCNQLSPNNSKSHGFIVDFSKPDESNSLVEQVIAKFGKLDVLVNNAGCISPAPLADPLKAYESYVKTRTVNIDATVKVTLAAIKHLQASNRDPNIVFISSGSSSRMAVEYFPYSLTKAAVTIFCKTLAIELAPNVRCNTVSPGPISTKLWHDIYENVDENEISQSTLLKRMGQTDDVAKAVHYLAGENGAWMTGTDLVIDGGYLLQAH